MFSYYCFSHVNSVSSFFTFSPTPFATLGSLGIFLAHPTYGYSVASKIKSAWLGSFHAFFVVQFSHRDLLITAH